MASISTDRLILRLWNEVHRVPFADMHADPEVMDDLGGGITRAESDRKFDRYVAAYERHGFSRWAVEDKQGRFRGYVGVMPRRVEHPLGSHDEIGWRLVKAAWGRGYATEAAKSALADAFNRAGLTEIIAYTSPANLRSQAVMSRLGMRRDKSRDFVVPDDRLGQWQGLVWAASPA